MQFKNLRRHLLLPKTLKRYNKRASFEMTTKRLYLLSLIYHFPDITDKRATRTNLLNMHTFMGKKERWQHLLRSLDDLIEAGLIRLDGPVYFATPLGVAVMAQIEKSLKNERFDRP